MVKKTLTTWRLALPLLALLMPSLAFGEKPEPPINWQEAVAEFAGERTRAEACASALKRHGDAAEISQGELFYAEAKAEVDAVIAGLIIALAENEQPHDWPAMQDQMKRGFAGRLAFCREVAVLIPEDAGVKSGIIDLLGDIVGPAIEAITAIFLDNRKADRLTRKTIQTQLEAAKWPSFTKIASP